MEETNRFAGATLFEICLLGTAALLGDSRANQFFKPGKNVDRLSQSIPNEFSTEAVSFIVQLELLISPAVLFT